MQPGPGFKFEVIGGLAHLVLRQQESTIYVEFVKADLHGTTLSHAKDL